MIFVECFIRGDWDEVWLKTQDPKLHERWDVRLSAIDYMPKGDDQIQRFTYSTRIGPGLSISGWGESVGTKLDESKRTSALKFGSDQAASLIREGSGYWQYEQGEVTVRFHTVYDYQVRWGVAGRVIDQIIFRPLMVWATALSFDRLRLWIERGLDPESTLRSWLIYRGSSVVLAFVWGYHALVPKLLSREAELKPILDAGFSRSIASQLLTVFIVGECIIALAFVFWPSRKWPWVLTIVAMPLLAIGAVITSPSIAVAPFNPVTLNLSVAAIATFGLLARADAPSASNCKYSAKWKPK